MRFYMRIDKLLTTSTSTFFTIKCDKINAELRLEFRVSENFISRNLFKTKGCNMGMIIFDLRGQKHCSERTLWHTQSSVHPTAPYLQFWNRDQRSWFLVFIIRRSWLLLWVRILNTICKVEKILKGSLVLIQTPSPSVKIQIIGGKVCLRCKGKTLLGIVNKLLNTKTAMFCLYTSSKLSRQ